VLILPIPVKIKAGMIIQDERFEIPRPAHDVTACEPHSPVSQLRRCKTLAGFVDGNDLLTFPYS
jgi:hypothetical protein